MPTEDDPLAPEAFAADDYVPAFFARNITEANEYCELLSDHEIPARAGLDEVLLDADPEHRAASRRGMTHGVPVLVPDRLLDEASEVIADREDLSDFEDEDEEESAELDDDDESFGLGEVVGDILDDDDEEEDDDEKEDDENEDF